MLLPDDCCITHSPPLSKEELVVGSGGGEGVNPSTPASPHPSVAYGLLSQDMSLSTWELHQQGKPPGNPMVGFLMYFEVEATEFPDLFDEKYERVKRSQDF